MLENYYLGTPIIISDKIGYDYKLVQKKTNKHKLLNKIFKKLFGMKQIKINNGQTFIFEDKIVMNKETYNNLKLKLNNT